LKPLDAELLCDWAKKTGKVLTVEENVLQGGFGSAVLELFQERGLFPVQVRRLGIPDTFVEHGPQALLREKYGIDENGIIKGVQEMFKEDWSDRFIQNQAKTSVKSAFLIPSNLNPSAASAPERRRIEFVPVRW